MLIFISALAGLTAFYLLYRHKQITAMLRPINDITTGILLIRPSLLQYFPCNPLGYLGGETSEL